MQMSPEILYGDSPLIETYPETLVWQRLKSSFNKEWTLEKIRKMQGAYFAGIKTGLGAYHPLISTTLNAPILRYMAKATGYNLAECIAFAETQYDLYHDGKLNGSWHFWTGEPPKGTGEYFVDAIKKDTRIMAEKIKVVSGEVFKEGSNMVWFLVAALGISFLVSK